MCLSSITCKYILFDYLFFIVLHFPKQEAAVGGQDLLLPSLSRCKTPLRLPPSTLATTTSPYQNMHGKVRLVAIPLTLRRKQEVFFISASALSLK